jgi:hypothetical protein
MSGVASFLRSQAGRRLAGVLGAAALVLVLAPASAAATVTRTTIATSSFEPGLTDDCRPGLTGTLVGTGTITMVRVDTPQGFHVDMIDSGTGTITWSDGSYSLIFAVDRTEKNIFDTGMRVRTTTHYDSVDTFTADGVFLSHSTFQEVFHVTFIDGAYVVRLDYGHFHFFDGC